MARQTVPLIGSYDRDMFGARGPLRPSGCGNGIIPAKYGVYWYGNEGGGNGWGAGVQISALPYAAAFAMDWGYPSWPALFR